jgi:hypothetical protein
MKSYFTQPDLNLQLFYAFVKSGPISQHQALLNKGVLLDSDNEGAHLVNLYYLDGFFVEETICNRHNSVVNILPYKRGYKLKSFLEPKINLTKNLGFSTGKRTIQ